MMSERQTNGGIESPEPVPEIKTTKVRRKSSTLKSKSTPTPPSTPKTFVPAKPIGNAPPPRNLIIYNLKMVF